MDKKPKKRFRAPKAKKGELKLQWGKFPGESPDVCVVWDTIDSRDASLLIQAFNNPMNRYMDSVQDPSLVDELKARGYDITTIKFSIQKLK